MIINKKNYKILILSLFWIKILLANNEFDNSIVLRDPFIPPVDFEEIKKEAQYLPIPIEIKGVVIDGERKYIILNEDIVEEKGNYQGMIIEKITKDFIILNYKNEEITIPIKKDS